MTRYDIILGKDPPPCAEPKPQKKKAPKKNKQEVAPRIEQTPPIVGRPSVNQTTRENILSRFLRTASGRSRLAASMVNPLRQRLDYSSVARRAFAVDPLPAGALPVYTADRIAYAVDELAQRVIELPIERGRITEPVPMFEVVSNPPQIPLTQIYERRYNLIDRAHDLAVNEIRSSEEEIVFMVLEILSNVREENFTTDLTDDTLRDAFESIEYGTENIFMSAHTFSAVRRLFRSQLEPRSRTEMFLTDSAVNLWGAQISLSRLCPSNQIYMLARPELVGRLPIRGFNVLDASGGPGAMIGWDVMESVGAVGFNPYAVARVTVQ
jgi:hypothetical protein